MQGRLFRLETPKANRGLQPVAHLPFADSRLNSPAMKFTTKLPLLTLASSALFFAPFSPHAQIAPAPAGIGFTHKSTSEFSYVANSDIKLGSVNLGEIDTTHSRLRYGASFQTSDSYSWRIGMEWERHSFGLPNGSMLPNTLNSIALNLGDSWKVNDKWMLQFEADPGIYSDLEDVGIEDFNAPLSFRALYFHRPNLIWTLAVIGNIKSEFPIVGGVGVRWLPTDRVTVDILLPRPQISYKLNDKSRIFAGGEFKGGGYRVAENFGTRVGRPDLNDQDLTYREVRVGAGIDWKITPKISAIVEGGWVIDRRFAFQDRDLQFNGDGAGFFQIAIKGSY